jgi:hypothetical protein
MRYARLSAQVAVIAVVEMSQSSWLVGGVIPGIEGQPRKKLEPSPEKLLSLPHRAGAMRRSGPRQAPWSTASAISANSISAVASSRLAETRFVPLSTLLCGATIKVIRLLIQIVGQYCSASSSSPQALAKENPTVEV